MIRSSSLSISLILLLILAFLPSIQAQILQVFPSRPTAEDEVTIIYDAGLGNGALAGDVGAVYAYAGVLTIESTHWSDWKYVKSGWCENLPSLRMEPLGNNRYQIRFHIRNFFRIPYGEEVVQLAFVFRNSDCSLVGRAANGEDILLELGNPSLDSYQAHRVDGNNLLVLDTDGDSMKVEAYTEEIIRLSYVRQGQLPEPSYASVLEPQPGLPVKIEETTGLVTYELGRHRVEIRKQDLGFTLFRDGNRLFSQQGAGIAPGRQEIRFEGNEGELFFGGGPRPLEMIRNERVLEMYNRAAYGYGLGDEMYKVSVPFVMGTGRYGLFFDNHYGAYLDFSGHQVGFFPEGGPLTTWLILSDDYEQIVSDYTLITGRQPLPPRWALGYIQSRFGYETETEARKVVQDLLSARFPLDALVIDLYWFGNTSTMGNLNWDRSRFPSPEKMMADFKDLGVETVLITEPYVTTRSFNFGPLSGSGRLATDRNDNTYVIDYFWAGPSALLDVYQPEVQNWWWNVYDRLLKQGVSGWWTDLGEPQDHPDDMWHRAGNSRALHNPYSSEWAKLIYDGMRTHYPDRRVFNLTRSGYAGIQRYGAITWSGDVGASFSGMKAQIPIMLTSSINGLAYMHSDAGGFAGPGSPELYTRWLQFSAFTPVMRPHSSSHFPEPVYYEEPTPSIVREFAQLRHQLLPYHYTLAWENSVTGAPLARPLFFYDDSAEAFQHLDEVYFWGRNLLVAPVLESGLVSRNVYLPPGVWIDFWTDQTFYGGRSVPIATPLSKMPLFVRAGSFIPMSRPFQTMADYRTDTLMVHYYPDVSVPRDTFVLYNDDGETLMAKEKGEFEHIRLKAERRDEELKIGFQQEGQYEGLPAQRQLNFVLHRIGALPDEVRLDGNLLPGSSSRTAFEGAGNTYFWDVIQNRLEVKFQWDHGPGELVIGGLDLTVDVGADPGVPVFRTAVYPNPTTGMIRLDISGPSWSAYQVQVLDARGKVVIEPVFRQKGVHWVDLDHLPEGIYFLQVRGLGESQAHKIVLMP